MAFGQQSGPPASAKQVQELLALLQQAGHADFRDARGPMGFNQRQAAGKFTRDEAAAFIDRLQAGGSDEAEAPVVAAEAVAPTPRPRRTTTPMVSLRDVPSSQLAAELQRRGWVVMEP
jgi:hypothetical protein